MAEWPFEVVYVNDGSNDMTDDELRSLMARYPWLRRVRHKQSCGQSAAVHSGVTAARAPLVVTLDGDGQNDPTFIPALIRALEVGAPRTGLAAGQRVAARRAVSRNSSRALRMPCAAPCCATGPATPAAA